MICTCMQENNTQTMPFPPNKDANAVYTAVPGAIVQLSGGELSFIAFSPNDTNANADGKWQRILNAPAPIPSQTSNSSNSSATGVGAQTASGAPSGSSTSGALGLSTPLVMAVCLGLLSAFSLL